VIYASWPVRAADFEYFLQQFINRLGVRAEDGWTDHGAHPLGGLGVRCIVDPSDDVLEIQHTDDVIDPFSDHRNPAKSRTQRQRDGLAQSLVLLDEDHVGARHHHLAGDRVAQVEDRVNHPAFAGFDLIPGLSEVHELT